MPWIKLFGPPSNKTCGRSVCPRVSTLKFCRHDRLKQRRHQLIRRRPDFLQAVNVGLGEHAALAGHLVQLDSVIALQRQLRHRNLQLRIDLVDDRARPARALVVHRRNFFLAAGLLIVLEDDDLRVLTAEFDHRIHFGMHLLDGERDRRNFLHELRADLLRDRRRRLIRS